jgi:carbamoyl-phosphate synthase large subunit
MDLVSEYLVSPPAEDLSFLGWIKKTVSDFGITFVIPASDAEVIALLESEDIGASVVGPSKSAVDISKDKLATANFFSENEIDGPQTQDIQSVAPTIFPVIVKPRSGRGSRDIYICNHIEELASLRQNFPQSIVQEMLTPVDAEMTCAVYRSEISGTRVLVMNRRLSGGTTSWIRVVKDDRISRYCEKIADCLNLRGSINIQLINTADGPKAFEINGRFSSTVAMRDQLGFSDLHWSIQEQVYGKICSYVHPKAGTELFRNPIQVVAE